MCFNTAYATHKKWCILMWAMQRTRRQGLNYNNMRVYIVWGVRALESFYFDYFKCYNCVQLLNERISRK